jgi:DNA repair protein RecN (Recombination protein N)
VDAIEKLQAESKKLAREVTTRMQGLGMAGGRFETSLTPLALADGTTSAFGLENIEFLVSANPGQPPRPLGKVASGGELSRLSLAVQVALATRAQRQQGAARCMVFDEVDSGVGGAVADLRVAKLTDCKATRTQIKKLTPDERVEETARMLGGIAITAKAREHAMEMLGPRGSLLQGTPKAKASATTRSRKR